MDTKFKISTMKINVHKYRCTAHKFNISSNHGIENWYFTMILLIARLCTHILHVLSFFGVRRVDMAYGLRLSQIKPLSSSNLIGDLALHFQRGSSGNVADLARMICG